MIHAQLTRRNVLKAGLGAAAWAVIGRHLAGYASAGEAASGKKRPNILLILADDMGYSDIGCYGGEIRTPNIDALAQRGVRFTQVYNNARCCPTRASILTGLYPHQAGVGGMLEETGLSGYTPCLNDQCVTIAEALRQSGYVTLMSGKWHVGNNEGHWPCDRGFDQSLGLISGSNSYWKTRDGSLVRNDRKLPASGEGFYMTDAFTGEALKMLDAHGKGPKPFFMYLAYTAPHWPLHAWPEDIKKYVETYNAGWDKVRQGRYDRMVKMGLINREWELTPQDSPPWDSAEGKDDMVQRMAVYAAQVDRMDQGIGKVLAKLKDIGAQDNTLVIFLSDNGGCAEVVDRGQKGVQAGPDESFLSYGKSWANVSNTPFVRYKHWVHEGGISTPLIAAWPGVIKGGGDFVRDVGHVIDLMPTCLEVAAAEYPKTYKDKPILPPEGASLLPLMRGKTRKAPSEHFWEHEGNRAVRQGKWKLVSVLDKDWELYDMELDRSETADLASKNPDKVKELGDKYDAWAKRCNVEPRTKVQAAIRAKKAQKEAATRAAASSSAPASK